MPGRFVGIDLGAETIKVVELVRERGMLRPGRRERVEHCKQPAAALLELLARWNWGAITGAAATGRFRRLVRLPRIPIKHAQATGFREQFGTGPATVVSIGGHGFSVLELRPKGVEVFRENSRCSQGTGNFLRQLVARFDFSIEEASRLCETVEDPAPLSGRCPVILKTDMTHLANKGESKARILAGLYDAVCENVQVLIKPRVSPPRVLLTGGVTLSRRIRGNFRTWLERRGMELIEIPPGEAVFLEALGCARLAAESAVVPPPLEDLRAPDRAVRLDRLPALCGSLDQVKHMPHPSVQTNGRSRRIALGFDIGSTGSKLVALDSMQREPLWEGYTETSGDPVHAAQELMRSFLDGPAAGHPVVALGATGSGREIVGSLLSSCFGVEAVYVLNEIAAHAEGALHYDPSVDTIFEIGGQDAKYIRLVGGRVVDAAMNEACSAGTGSFIEEQGRKFAGIEDVVQLGREALQAPEGVSLGQHCSVFMAEIIDEAVAAGVENRTIVAGIYDSIIQNYLNRVKGSRSVGQVIFCQGMPFSADALAAAVARQTGSRVVVPPSPGTVGALGIALLACKTIPVDRVAPIDPRRFLEAQVVRKDTFVCKSTRGCGGSGNRCRIDRIATEIGGNRGRFTWGGGCSLWDRGTGKVKLPDRAPDPFRERAELAAAVRERYAGRRGGPTVGLSDEFQLKDLFPFFAAFLHGLGFDLVIRSGADRTALKRGIECANVSFCAPMQQFHGLAAALAEEDADQFFLPMLREVPRMEDEAHAVVCPIVQASPDLLRWDLPEGVRSRIRSPVIDFGAGNFASREFLESCREAARQLGAPRRRFRDAFEAGVGEQECFDAERMRIGTEALEFCGLFDLVPVIVLGRPYTIHNQVLNSNVPALLREQGAMAVPVDCYPVASGIPVLREMYWAYGQRNLRAAEQVRATRGVYSLWCSNYSCGPDSFNLHFYRYVMEGKPFAVIETDGHAGDAGTKTRVEAFLHCVKEDLRQGKQGKRTAPAASLRRIERKGLGMPEVVRQKPLVLIPRMGPVAEALAACLRGIGVPAEALPQPDRESVRLGRRHTSGKECVPMCVTLGSLLQRLGRDGRNGRRYAFFMPTCNGPCRFGCYNLLHKITLERLGHGDRVGVWSPDDGDYFAGVAGGFSALVFTGFAAMDMLQEALFDVRPGAADPGRVDDLHARWSRTLVARLEQAGREDLSVAAALAQVGSGRLFGCASLLREAAAEFAAHKTGAGPEKPTVMVVGEIYVRSDPFTNDFIIDRLERHGMRVRFAPFTEWLEYTDRMAWHAGTKRGFGARLRSIVQARIQARAYAIFARVLGWPRRTSVRRSLAAAAPYLREELEGEAVLTVGGPLHEWREGLIDGVVSVGPLECMPTRISQSQFFHVAEREGLPTLTIPYNGDPLDPEILDNFLFEVRRGKGKRRVHP